MKIQITRTKVNWKEFSKRIVSAMCILWIAGAIFGGYIVYKDSNQLSYLLDYIGDTMKAGVIGYLLKSAFENREKIKKGSTSGSTETTPSGEPYES